MHRHDGPRDHAAASHFQLLTRRQLNFRGIIQKFFLYSVVIFLPTVVREGSDIVENEAVVLGVELRRSLRISGAPRRAKAVDESAERSVIRGLLLCPGSNESQQGANDRQPHIQHPAPSFGIIGDSSAHRCGHSLSPRNSGNESLQGDVPTGEAYRSPFGTILQALLFGLIGIGDLAATAPLPATICR